MLSTALNDLITQTGPGTPCGRFLRSCWQPIAALEEMPVGGAPMPVRIMSEDLVLFRDDKDRLHRHRHHRGAQGAAASDPTGTGRGKSAGSDPRPGERAIL